MSATLVPVFVDRFEAEDDDGISAVVTIATVALVVLTVVAVLAAPAIFRVYTLRKSPAEAHELARVGVPLTRLFLPQILFYGFTALGTALLNARRRFAAPAIAPVLNNLVVVAALILFARAAGRAPSIEEVRSDRGLLLLLGLGTTAGIAAMTVALWGPLRRAGVRLRWRFRPRDPAVRKVAALSGWTVGYVVANQIALAVVLALAGAAHGRRVRLHVRLRVLPAASRALRRVADDDLRARAVVARQPPGLDRVPRAVSRSDCAG